MSWDVLIMRIPEGISSPDEIPEDCEPLCSREELSQRLRLTFPDIDLTDPSWAILEADDYSIEFNVGDGDPCDSLMLHVRGEESALEPIRLFCENTGFAALDAGTGEFLDFSDSDPAPGFRAWRVFRKKALPDAPIKGVRITFPPDSD